MRIGIVDCRRKTHAGSRCVVCRQRKVACNRQRPRCGLCVKYDFECEYKGRQQRPGLRAGYVSRLEEQLSMFPTDSPSVDPGRVCADPTELTGNVEARLRVVEGKLARGDTGEERHDASPAHSPVHVTPFRPRSCSPASASASSAAMPESRHHDVTNSMGRTPSFPPYGSGPDLPWDFVSPAVRGGSLDAPHATSHLFPEAAEIRSVWYRKYHPWFPILHETSFERASNAGQDSPQRLVYEAIVCILSCDARGLLQQREPPNEASRRMRDAVVQRAMQVNSLRSIQALLIVSIYYYTEANLTMFWNLLAVCKR